MNLWKSIDIFAFSIGHLVVKTLYAHENIPILSITLDSLEIAVK